MHEVPLTRAALLRSSLLAAAGVPVAFAQTALPADHIGWVEASLKRIQSIQPGMTRAQLLEVFTTEGGLSTGVRRTYVSRDCLYFKVDVQFRPVGRSARDIEGRITVEEDERDVIIEISRPYLQFSIRD